MKPHIIGICGGSGSGKSSVLKEIRSIFSTNEVCLLSHDNYYKPIEEQELDRNGEVNFDLPSSYDNLRFISDLNSIAKGQDVIIEEYTFNNPNIVPKKLRFDPAPVIIVEGLFIFHEIDIRSRLDLKVFVQTDIHLMLSRRIIRDQKCRNYPLDDVLYRYENHAMPAFEQFIAPHIRTADIIIQNNFSYKPGATVLSSYIRGVLENS